LTGKKSCGRKASGSHCNEDVDQPKILIPLSGSIDVADLKNITPDQIVKGEVVAQLDSINAVKEQLSSHG